MKGLLVIPSFLTLLFLLLASGCTPPGPFSIGGTVDGINESGGSVTLSLNSGAENITLSNDGGYTFEKQFYSGNTYNIVIVDSPDAYTCNVAHSQDIISGTVNDIDIYCALSSVSVPPCLTINNTAAEDIANNNWFDACVAVEGNNVRVVLEDSAGNVLYDTIGSKVGSWAEDFITYTNTDLSSQAEVNNHDQLITLGNGDKLMISGKSSNNYFCGGALANGYGISIYPSVPVNYEPKLLVLPFAVQKEGATGGIFTPPQIGSPRTIEGWSRAHEVSYSPGEFMGTCPANTVAPYSIESTFYFYVLP